MSRATPSRLMPSSIDGAALPWHLRAKYFGFQTFLRLRKRNNSVRVTTLGQAVRIICAVLDCLFTVFVVAGMEVGWPAEQSQWMLDLQVPWIFVDTEANYRLFFGIACGCVWAMLGLIVLTYITPQTPTSFLRRLPVRSANVLGNIMHGPLFVPIAITLMLPLKCSNMEIVLQDTSLCDASLASYQAVGVATALVWAPIAAGYSLLVHDTTSNSPRLMAMVNGRWYFFSALARVLAVLGPIVLSPIPGVADVMNLFAFSWLAISVVQQLPFYHPFANRLHTAATVSIAWAALGTLTQRSLKGMDPGLFSTIWLYMTIVAFIVGFVLPSLRYKQLEKILMALRPGMEEDIQGQHKAQPAFLKWTTSTGSMANLARGTKNFVLAARKHRISSMAAKVHGMKYVENRMPFNPRSRTSRGNAKEEDLEASKPLTETVMDIDPTTVFDGRAAYEVELLVRTELSLPGNTDSRKRRRRIGRTSCPVPTAQAVEHATWLFAQAIEEFCDDPVHIATVKIEMARFLHVYTADTSLAATALEAAAKEAPSLDNEFELYHRQSEMQTPSGGQGQAGQADGVGLMDYSKRLLAAVSAHEKALNYRQRLLKSIDRHQHTMRMDDEGLAEQFGASIRSMASSTETAQLKYRVLLRAHSSAPYLADCYGRFAADVMNDLELAAQYETGGEGGRSVSQGSRASRGSKSRSVQSSVAGNFSQRTWVPKSRTGEVARISTQFIAGIGCLLLVTLCMFITTRVLLQEVSADVVALAEAGLLRWGAVVAAEDARQLSLEPTEFYVNRTEHEMTVFKGVLRKTFDFTIKLSHEAERWSTPDIELKDYKGNGTWETSMWTLWDASNQLVADVDSLVDGVRDGSMDLVNDHHDNHAWRWVMDNSVLRILPPLLELTFLMEDEIFRIDFIFIVAQGCLLFVSFCIVLVLGFGVFARTVRRVRLINQGVNRVAKLIGTEHIPVLRRQVVQGLIFVRQVKQKIRMMGVEQETEAERGLGPTEGFTYDADAAKGKGARARRSSSPLGAAGSGGGVGVGAGRTKPQLASGQTGSSSFDAQLEGLGTLRAIGDSMDGLEVSDFKSPHPMELPHMVTPRDEEGADAASNEAASVTSSPEPVQRGDSQQLLLGDQGVAFAAAEAEAEAQGVVESKAKAEAELGEGGSGEGKAGAEEYSEAAFVDFSDDDDEEDEDDEAMLLLPDTESNHNLLKAVDSRVRMRKKAESKAKAKGGVANGGHTVVIMAEEDEDGQLGASKKKRVGFASVDTGSSRGRGRKLKRADSVVRAPLGRVLNSVHAAVVAFLPSGEAVYANKQAVEMFAVAEDEDGDEAKEQVLPDAWCRTVTLTKLFAPSSITDIHAHLTHAKESKGNDGVDDLDMVDSSKDHLPLQAMVNGKRVAVSVHIRTLASDVFVAIMRREDSGSVDGGSDTDTSGDELGGDAGGKGGSGRGKKRHGSRRRKAKGGAGRQSLVIRVTFALLLVAGMQAANFTFGAFNLESAALRSAELNQAGLLRKQSTLMALMARELAIGDNEMFPTQQDAEDYGRKVLVEHEAIRAGLRYGDDSRHLAGSAGRSIQQDTLQFGEVANHELHHGLDPELKLMQRTFGLVLDKYHDPANSIGLKPQVLSSDPTLHYFEESLYNHVAKTIVASIGVYRTESVEQVDSILLTDIFVSIISAVLVILLYVVVLRRLTKELLSTARWTEDLLMVLPEDLATSNTYKGLFVRAGEEIA